MVCATGDVQLHFMASQTQLVDGAHDFDEPFLRYKYPDAQHRVTSLRPRPVAGPAASWRIKYHGVRIVTAVGGLLCIARINGAEIVRERRLVESSEPTTKPVVAMAD